jgi:hypothetical protein
MAVSLAVEKTFILINGVNVCYCLAKEKLFDGSFYCDVAFAAAKRPPLVVADQGCSGGCLGIC